LKFCWGREKERGTICKVEEEEAEGEIDLVGFGGII